MPAKKKHDWSKFVLRVAVKASPEKLFRAWTDDRIVSRWFTVKTVIEPRKNGRIHFQWLAGDTMEARVIRIVKNRLFVFPFGRNRERVEVRIKKDGKGSICELRQSGMKTTDEAKWSMHRGCMSGWTFFLTNLKSVLEHGVDLRSRDPKRSYRQDFVNS